MGKTEDNEITKLDFYEDKKYLFYLLGFTNEKGWKAVMFRAIIYLVHAYMQITGFLALVLVQEKELKVSSAHSFILAIYACYGLTIRLLTSSSLERARAQILCGVYRYPGEGESGEELAIRRRGEDDIRLRLRVMGIAMGVAACFVAVVIPVTQLYFLSDRRAEGRVLNPYLPIPIYIPFSTAGPLGFAFGMALNFLNLFAIYGSTLCISQIFLTCSLQLKVQLQILNYSIKNVEKRAWTLYRRSNNNPLDEDMFSLREFQDCLFHCLRSNARHHQALLRFHNEFKTYTGGCLLASAFFAAIILGCDLFLIFSKAPTYMLIIYILIFMAELPYNYFLCFVGQEILEEGETLYQTLYDTPWYHCDSRFNRLLITMMLYSFRPLRLKTLALDFTASSETYGDLTMGMYKIMNLVRNNNMK